MKSTNVQSALDELHNKIAKKGASYIIALFDNDKNTTFTTTNGEKITQATNAGLMKDSFGNIRYYGANPNNYVTFNGENAGWRIIGVFNVEDENGNIEKRIKLIRTNNLGQYSFDTKPSGVGSSTSEYGSNDWSDARLMMLLNPGYETASDLYEYEGSLYWNKKSGTCYEGKDNTTCDFTTTGLTTEAKAMIEKSKYYLGGIVGINHYANELYTYERQKNVIDNHSTEWVGYIALPYPSDYAYATDLKLCTKYGENYDDNNCKYNDWLLDEYYGYWFITPVPEYTYLILGSNTQGKVGYVHNGYPIGTSRLYPTFYLSSDVKISSGSGTADNPYQLSIE